MPTTPATLADLMTVLNQVPPDTATEFRADGQNLGQGYHITELKLADIRSIDCGGRTGGWTEAQMQLLDGPGEDDALTTGKVLSILARCLSVLPDLAKVPLSVECAPSNRGLGRYELGVPMLAEGRLVLPLVADRAQCKPAVETGCCTASACCG